MVTGGRSFWNDPLFVERIYNCCLIGGIMPFKIPINQLTPDFHDSGYKITGPDINDRRVIVNSITLKVEKETAKAMIEGFDKIDGRYYVTIYTANKKAWSLLGNFRENPDVEWGQPSKVETN